MKRTALLLLSVAVALPLWATAQAPDILKIDGKTYNIHTNPLEPYLLANPGRMPPAEVSSTGLWRGYIAKWLLREDRLFLDDVRVPTKSEAFKSVLKALFGNSAPRVAAWFTGHLVVPTGEIVKYV